MIDEKLRETITVTCPSGHRLRGDASLIGKKVSCPSCQQKFAIAEPKPAVTDSSVLRILGDGPARTAPPELAQTKSCPRCGLSNNETASVCKHCDCYMGAVPSFMSQLLSGERLRRS